MQSERQAAHIVKYKSLIALGRVALQHVDVLAAQDLTICALLRRRSLVISMDITGYRLSYLQRQGQEAGFPRTRYRWLQSYGQGDSCAVKASHHHWSEIRVRRLG